MFQGRILRRRAREREREREREGGRESGKRRVCKKFGVHNRCVSGVQQLAGGAV
jgi:hypothetical protein